MILIPAAGKGQRFKEAGYTEPKHLIPLSGVPLIGWVKRNLHVLSPGDEVRVVTAEDVGETRGIVETILRAEVDPAAQLVIGNCDQLLKLPEDGNWRRGHGVVFTFPSVNPAHSYVTVDDDMKILDIREKQVISGRAVSGVYWFKSAGPLLSACKEVLENGEGELYLSRAIERLLLIGFNLYAHDAPTAILGTPEDFQRFEVAMNLCS